MTMELKRLRIIRENNNLKQKDIAKILGISLGTYGMNETAHDTITLKNLIKFCDYFNVSLDYIFGFTNNYNYINSRKGYDKDILTKRLKESRKDAGLTQVRVGVLLNIDHSVWCRYEQGKTFITTSFLYTYCEKLNISADYLLGKIDNSKHSL